MLSTAGREGQMYRKEGRKGDIVREKGR